MRTGSLVSETIRPGSWTKVAAKAHMAPTTRTQRLTGSGTPMPACTPPPVVESRREEGNDDVATRGAIVDGRDAPYGLDVPAVR